MNTLQSQVILARTLEVQAVTQAAVGHADQLQRQAQALAPELAARKQELVIAADASQAGQPARLDEPGQRDPRSTRRPRRERKLTDAATGPSGAPGLGLSVDKVI